MRPTLDLDVGFEVPRNIFGDGGVHIHHAVIGVILVMVSGVTVVTLAVHGGVPEFTASSILFGIGAALVRTGIVGRSITPRLFIGAIRVSRTDVPWSRWLQYAVAGMPKFREDAKVEEQLDPEIYAAPTLPDRDPVRQEVS